MLWHQKNRIHLTERKYGRELFHLYELRSIPHLRLPSFVTFPLIE